MTCHSKFAESPEARFLRVVRENGAGMGGAKFWGNTLNVTSQTLTSLGTKKRLGIGSGNMLAPYDPETCPARLRPLAY